MITKEHIQENYKNKIVENNEKYIRNASIVEVEIDKIIIKTAELNTIKDSPISYKFTIRPWGVDSGFEKNPYEERMCTAPNQICTNNVKEVIEIISNKYSSAGWTVSINKLGTFTLS